MTVIQDAKLGIQWLVVSIPVGHWIGTLDKENLRSGEVETSPAPM